MDGAVNTRSPGVLVGEGRTAKPRRDYNWKRVSRTDPDASVVTRPVIGTGLFYKEHFTVDSSRVITAVQVTSGATDDAAPVAALLDQQPVTPKVFCADSNYGVPDVYADLKRRRIRPVIPRRTPHMHKPRPGHIHASAFRYDPEKDIYICPQNRNLRRITFEAKLQRYHYRPRISDCQQCSLKKVCTQGKSVRTVTRAKEQDAIEWALRQLGTAEATTTMRERSVIAEGTVGEAKTLHGLRRASCRGLEKVGIQAVLIAAVQNMKRLVRRCSAITKRRILLASHGILRRGLILFFSWSSATAPSLTVT